MYSDVLGGAHDVDAVGFRDRGHERKVASPTRVNAAIERRRVELPCQGPTGSFGAAS
jgi:hypothetical protein